MTSKAIVTQTQLGVRMHSVESVQEVLNQFPQLSRERLVGLYTKFDAYDRDKRSIISAVDLQDVLKQDEVFTSPKQIARIIRDATGGRSSSELSFNEFVAVMLAQDTDDDSKKLHKGGDFKFYHDSASSVISKFESGVPRKESSDAKLTTPRTSGSGTVAAAKAALLSEAKGFERTRLSQGASQLAG